MGTKNYGFYTEDNSATKFKEWRKKINGSDGSNIVMICLLYTYPSPRDRTR